jgi:RNA polymerase sigma-70 factor (ECF subfamily)
MIDNQQETQTPPANEWFTTTHWSVVLRAGESGSPLATEALEKLCRTYWLPLYSYIRRQGHSSHDAQDLTQEFFARLLARNYLASVQREEGKFRSFLLASLNHFLADQRDRATAAKRGGGQPLISLNEEDAERLYLADAATNASPDKVFEKRWATTLLGEAFSKLRAEFLADGKAERFEQLKPFLEQGTDAGQYGALATAWGIAPNAVAATVYRLRQRYRELVRAEIAHTVANPEEIKEEMRHLFAALTG